jgi:hypothetical protein
MFQPIQVVCSFLRRLSAQDLERWKVASEDQHPALEAHIRLSPLVVEFRQDRLRDIASSFLVWFREL